MECVLIFQIAVTEIIYQVKHLAQSNLNCILSYKQTTYQFTDVRGVIYKVFNEIIAPSSTMWSASICCCLTYTYFKMDN